MPPDLVKEYGENRNSLMFEKHKAINEARKLKRNSVIPNAADVFRVKKTSLSKVSSFNRLGQKEQI